MHPVPENVKVSTTLTFHKFLYMKHQLSQSESPFESRDLLSHVATKACFKNARAQRAALSAAGQATRLARN